MDSEAAGKQWQRWREDAGLDQDEAAEIAGTSRGSLSRYETGKRPMPRGVAEKLAVAYGVTSVARETTPSEFDRGVLHAARAMSATLTKLLDGLAGADDVQIGARFQKAITQSEQHAKAKDQKKAAQ